jgi:hypothetical protein
MRKQAASKPMNLAYVVTAVAIVLALAMLLGWSAFPTTDRPQNTLD